MRHIYCQATFCMQADQTLFGVVTSNAFLDNIKKKKNIKFCYVCRLRAKISLIMCMYRAGHSWISASTSELNQKRNDLKMYLLCVLLTSNNRCFSDAVKAYIKYSSFTGVIAAWQRDPDWACLYVDLIHKVLSCCSALQFTKVEARSERISGHWF